MDSIVVAITQRVDSISGRNEKRDSLDQRLLKWVKNAGFIPIVVPNILLQIDSNGEISNSTKLENWLNRIRPDAFLLSGGNDIGQYQERDCTEAYLLTWAKDLQLPALGICRGMQMMAVWAGATLTKVDGHVRTNHTIISADKNVKFPETVNSFHDWAIVRCPDDFHIMATANDGVIEAIKHSLLPWEGWMWHPERDDKFTEYDTNRLRRLFLNQLDKIGLIVK